MRSANEVLSSQPVTIFAIMSALAKEHNAINLGQGFPSGEGPEDLRAAAARYTMEGPNQYPPVAGMDRLRQAVAEHDKRFYGIEAEWQDNVLITSGATEALTACFMGLINPGDEAVLIEPVYDSYRPIIEAMGGVVRTVRLQPPEWSIPEEDLKAAFSQNTKLVVVNNPMNPIGKVFTREELELIADQARAHDCYVVCDEVYEHLVFPPAEFIPMITLPGLETRAAKIGSAGKSFSLTGWKVGYVTADKDLMTYVNKAHQFLTYTTPPNLQLAVADGLGKEDHYFEDLAAGMVHGRDLLSRGLSEIGFDMLPCDGTYFLTADFSKLSQDKDFDFCVRMTKEAGVTAIPLSSFYGDPDTAPKHLVRFCFCKEDVLLKEAIERLGRYFK